MGKYSKQKNNMQKSNEQRFYENTMRKIGRLILYTVSVVISIVLTILFGVECATSGGYWVYLLSLIICITATVICIGAVIVGICDMLLFVKGLYDGKVKY